MKILRTVIVSVAAFALLASLTGCVTCDKSGELYRGPDGHIRMPNYD